MRTSRKEKTCPFSAASRNSANVGGRASQFGGHRFQMCVPYTCNVCNAVPACSSRGRVVKVSRWKSGWKSETGRRAGRVMGRPSGLSPDTLACVHLSGQEFYENRHQSLLLILDQSNLFSGSKLPFYSACEEVLLPQLLLTRAIEGSLTGQRSRPDHDGCTWPGQVGHHFSQPFWPLVLAIDSSHQF